MKSNIKIIGSIMLMAFVSVYAYYQPSKDPRSSETIKRTESSILPVKAEPDPESTSPQRVHPIRISGKVTFAGEPVPLNDRDVRERFDKELMVNTFWHSNTLLNFKLANRYFAIIEKILKEEGVPLDFKYLAVAESGLRDISSPAGASGVWQIMPATAKSYGLIVTDQVDERYDLEKSTRVACKYLKEAKAKFGSWALAAAAYNAGMGNIQNRINEQLVNTYYDLYLNTETARYLYRILSYKMVFENPHKFGLYLEPEDLYDPIQYDEVIVTSSIDDLIVFAKAHNTTYKMLKITNPWLREKALTIKDGAVFTVKIPKNYIDAE